MAAQLPQRLQLIKAVTSLVAEAAENHRIVHTAIVAAELAERYPACGMALGEIEDEVVRQIGLARGAAQIGGGNT